MGNSISFEMSSTYSPEWKKELKLSTLYDYIAKYKKEVENEKDSEKYPLHDQAMDRVNSSDDSSIRSKLKNKLHLDISESINLRGKELSEENYKEKYDALKLLYFLATFAKIEDGSTIKSIDPLDLLIYSSLQHTDAANAVYAKDFRRMITELRPTVTDPENREDTINWIHGLWEQMHINISCTAIIQMTFIQGHVQNTDLEKIISQLQMIKDSIDIEIIYSTSYFSDGILNAFYNKMLCSRILAELADMQKVIYDYQDETAVPKDVDDLFKSDEFSKQMSWEKFHRIIDFKTVDYKSPIDMAVCAILLGKSEFSRQEIKTMLFQNQSPANVGQVYDIVVDAMNQMQIPYSKQTLDYVMNAITPIVQNAQWQTAQAQEMTVALTNAVTDVLAKYKSEVMQNARLKKEKQSAIRYFSIDETNVGWCREGTKETKIGYFKIHSVMDIKIGKDETYRDYKYVEYEDSQAQIRKCMIPLDKIAAKTLVSCFNGFSYICSSKQIANDFLAWCIKNYANPKQITIPEYPGFTLKEVNGQRQIDFNANDGEHDNSLLERCSEHFKKKILLSGKLLPEDISAAAANYLNTSEKVVLFVNGICGVLSTVLLDIQEPISQILTVAVPSNDYIKPACCYLQTYNKGKNALSFDDNITAIRKLIRSAKDETAVLTDCIHADNTIRREEVIRELLVLNTNAGCKPHNLAVISTCGQYLIPSKQKICLTLSEDFEHAMSYEAEQKMCLALSLLTRFIIHVACQDYERFSSNLKKSIAAYRAAASQYDLPCPESETSFSVMAAVTDMLNKNQALPVRIQDVHKLLLEMLQVSAEVEGDASDAVADEFVKVLNDKLRTDRISMLIQSKDMDFISGKAQAVVKDELLLLEETTITDVILPEMQTTDSVHRILSALSEADLLFATKKNRYPSTVYCKGQSSRVSFIAVKMDDILDQDVKQKFETQACAEWFRAADDCAAMIPLVKNELGLTAVRKFDFESQENLHCFVTGKSGSGKTHFMTEYIVSLQQAGQKVVILDTSDSFTKSAILKNLSVCGGSQALSAAKDFVEQHFTFHQIENDGIPVEILALDYPSAEITKRKIIYSILTANIANVGKKQRAELNRCIEQLLCSSQPSVVGFCDVLESEEVSDSISMQFEDILAPFIEYKQNEDTWGEFLQKTNDIVVISSAAISGSGGSAMVDMLLMSLFYYQRNNPEAHLAVVIDEIQNQNCGGSSPIAQVLKEGRKYHMSLTYATQSLSDKNKDTMKTMNNADMRIYMKPDETSARSIARSLDIAASELTQMQKGECYVNGTIYNNLMQSNESGLIHGYTYRHFITE